MLKMGTSTYNDHRRGSQWIKLKKDYIPGLGDSVSCCIVGASWDKTRARQLRGMYFIDAADEADIDNRKSPHRATPHFTLVYWRTSKTGM